jgi:hypothetical protein
MITVAIPVKEPCPTLRQALGRIQEIQDQNPGLIMEVFTESKGSLPEARLIMARRALEPLILSLDADTLIPLEYLPQVVRLYKTHNGIGAVALDYFPKPQGHLAFGTSVMPTITFLETYDWPGPELARTCECMYMWRRLTAAGKIVATLPMAAEHKTHI